MPNILDLRKKEIQIVEKIVLKKRLWYIETLKMLGVLAITISVTWAFSNASLFTEETDETPAPLKQRIPKFSAIGIVSLITDDTISLSDAHGTKSEDTTFPFDTSSISKIETKSYDPLSLSDILVGDKVITQGTIEDENIIITRIISFGVVETPPPVPEVIPEIILEVVEEIIDGSVLGVEDEAPAEGTEIEPSPEEIPTVEEPVVEPEVIPETPLDTETPPEEVEPTPEATIPEEEPIVEEELVDEPEPEADQPSAEEPVIEPLPEAILPEELPPTE